MAYVMLCSRKLIHDSAPDQENHSRGTFSIGANATTLRRHVRLRHPDAYTQACREFQWPWLLSTKVDSAPPGPSAILDMRPIDFSEDNFTACLLRFVARQGQVRRKSLYYTCTKLILWC